jgi:gamma-glutamyltranspeptidase
MHNIELTPEALAAAAGLIPADRRIFMVNLLKYRERADYGGSAGQSPPSGREVYRESYVPAFRKLAADQGVAVFWLGHVAAAVVAPPGEGWHDVGIVEYPDFATFRRIVESPEYLAKASPHRKAALEDWRLIATTAAS